MKYFIAMILGGVLLALTGCLAPPVDTNVLSGSIYWHGEVHVHGEMIIAPNAVLTIAPGTRVVFEPHSEPLTGTRKPHELRGSRMLVHGKIVAHGTPQKPIVFMAADPDAQPGSWGGIKIQDARSASFSYCEFSQATNALHSCRSWVSVEYSRFQNNKVAILFHDTEMLIERNLFRENGTAIYFLSGSPVICENKMTENDQGLVIADASGRYRIANNSFIDNRAYNVGLGERVRNTVDLRENYWGTTDASRVENKLFDGRHSLWSGQIVYRPMRSTPVKAPGLR